MESEQQAFAETWSKLGNDDMTKGGMTIYEQVKCTDIYEA